MAMVLARVVFPDNIQACNADSLAFFMVTAGVEICLVNYCEGLSIDVELHFPHLISFLK